MNLPAPLDPPLDPPATPPAGAAEGPATGRVGARLYFGASLLGQVAALLRYVTLARLLGPEQLGLAATLVVTSAFFDMISETGSDRFLIQDRDGDALAVQRLVQLVYASRGALIAVALVIFAIPIAAFYKTPRLAEGIAFLAISPFILGFLHLDIRRMQRRLDFRSEALCRIAGESASLVATVAAAFLTRDFTAILYGLITRSAVMVLVSHLLAERPYGLAYHPQHGPRLARFAAPLMLTGVLLFVGSQGDRVVVANRLGFAALGHYSAVLLLIYYPSAVLLSYVHALYVPMVAAGRDDAARRDRVSDTLGGQTLLLAVGMAAGFAIVAPFMTPLLYGGRYRQAALVIGLIGILQTTRFLIVWPTTVALSIGRSRTVFLSNLTRLFVFPGAYLGAVFLGGLAGVVAGFIAGELLSIVVALVLVNRDTGRPAAAGFDRFAVFLLTAAAIVAGDIAAERRSAILAAAVLVAAALLTGWILRSERQVIAEAIAAGRRLAGPRLSLGRAR